MSPNEQQNKKCLIASAMQSAFNFVQKKKLLILISKIISGEVQTL